MYSCIGTRRVIAQHADVKRFLMQSSLKSLVVFNVIVIAAVISFILGEEYVKGCQPFLSADSLIIPFSVALERATKGIPVPHLL